MKKLIVNKWTVCPRGIKILVHREDRSSEKDESFNSIKWTDHLRRTKLCQIREMDGPPKEDGNFTKTYKMDGPI